MSIPPSTRRQRRSALSTVVGEFVDEHAFARRLSASWAPLDFEAVVAIEEREFDSDKRRHAVAMKPDARGQGARRQIIEEGRFADELAGSDAL
jgi:hypothetical protein